mgnify:CR=1 FL=1
MFCSHCGQELKEGGKFCPRCGAPVDPQREQALAQDIKK